MVKQYFKKEYLCLIKMMPCGLQVAQSNLELPNSRGLDVRSTLVLVQSGGGNPRGNHVRSVCRDTERDMDL